MGFELILVYEITTKEMKLNSKARETVMGGKHHEYPALLSHRADMASLDAERRLGRPLGGNASSGSPKSGLQEWFCAYREIEKPIWDKLMKTELL